MDVFIKGKGAVKLSQNDFRAAGGEGSVFCKSGLAYKIYSDPKKMIPVGKIQELAKLTKPYIIKPEDVLLDKANVPIGYTMKALNDTTALCSMFPKAFRDRNNISPDMSLNLVRILQEGTQHCHDHKNLIVDLNEMNFLMDKTFTELYFIDVDSYQTPHYPATALMESVRDRHNKGFTEDTDWFSFGIVSFQMFVGIHPYKGKHSTIKGLDERMLANISVLNSSVSVPGACLPFDVIPQNYKDWYEAIFEKGKRCPPPDTLVNVVVLSPRITRIAGSQKFVIDPIITTDGDIIYASDGLVVAKNGIYVGGRKYLADASDAVGLTPKMNRILSANVDHGKLRLFDGFFKKELPITLNADAVMSTDGRIYVKYEDGLYEIDTVELPNVTLANSKRVGNVLPQATQLFEGVAIQNLLGAYYASLLPKSGACHQIRIKELDGYRIVDSAFKHGVMIVVAEKNGLYDKFIFRFEDDYQTYDTRIANDVGIMSVNYVVLDSGVTIHMNENEELELFSKKKGSTGVKIIADPAITGDCILFKNGGQACFAKSDTLYSFTMKV